MPLVRNLAAGSTRRHLSAMKASPPFRGVSRPSEPRGAWTVLRGRAATASSWTVRVAPVATPPTAQYCSIESSAPRPGNRRQHEHESRPRSRRAPRRTSSMRRAWRRQARVRAAARAAAPRCLRPSRRGRTPPRRPRWHCRARSATGCDYDIGACDCARRWNFAVPRLGWLAACGGGGGLDRLIAEPCPFSVALTRRNLRDLEF